MQNYTIQSGDTLSAIATKAGTTVAALLAANPSISNPNVIKSGASLNIPAATTLSSLQAQLKNGIINSTAAQQQIAYQLGSQYGGVPSDVANPKAGVQVDGLSFQNTQDAQNFKSALSGVVGSVFGNLGVVTQGGQSGTFDSSGNFIQNSTKDVVSSTTGAGTTSSTSAIPSSSLSQITNYLSGIGAPTDSNSVGALYQKVFGGTYNGTTNQNTQLYSYMTQPNANLTAKAFSTITGITPTTSSSSTGANGSFTSGINVGSTGNSNLDTIQNSLLGLANNIVSSGYTIPTTLQITPALVSQFLSYAHQAVDPYTQQLLTSEITNVNNDLQNQQQQYNLSQGQAVQQFGTQLASQDNSAGANGVAFSGGRQVADNNLVNSTNRSLASLSSSAALGAENSLNAGAAQVGAANAGGFNLPTFATGSVGLGGQFGNYSGGGTAPLNYNPSNYTVGTIPSNAAQNVSNLQQSYISQYGTLAGNNSNGSRSVSDLIGMMSGLPAGYSVPSSLM